MLFGGQDKFGPIKSHTSYRRKIEPAECDGLGICTSRFKLVRLHHKPWQLFDMELDRTELNHLAAKGGKLEIDLPRCHNYWAQKSGMMDWNVAPPRVQAALKMDAIEDQGMHYACWFLARQTAKAHKQADRGRFTGNLLHVCFANDCLEGDAAVLTPDN